MLHNIYQKGRTHTNTKVSHKATERAGVGVRHKLYVVVVAVVLDKGDMGERNQAREQVISSG